jgi:hypothetical protein
VVGITNKEHVRSRHATLPKLLYERMDEIGLDFTVLYPSLGLMLPHIEDPELRQASCRALNAFHADYYREFADRMTPARRFMETPQERLLNWNMSSNS